MLLHELLLEMKLKKSDKKFIILPYTLKSIYDTILELGTTKRLQIDNEIYSAFKKLYNDSKDVNKFYKQVTKKDWKYKTKKYEFFCINKESLYKYLSPNKKITDDSESFIFGFIDKEKYYSYLYINNMISEPKISRNTIKHILSKKIKFIRVKFKKIIM